MSLLVFMEDADIKEYAARCWTELSGGDRNYWASLYRRSGFNSTMNASVSLWQHMKSIQRDWPSDAQRRRDLEDHIAFKQLLDRIADAFATGSPSLRS